MTTMAGVVLCAHTLMLTKFGMNPFGHMGCCKEAENLPSPTPEQQTNSAPMDAFHPSTGLRGSAPQSGADDALVLLQIDNVEQNPGPEGNIPTGLIPVAAPAATVVDHVNAQPFIPIVYAERNASAMVARFGMPGFFSDSGTLSSPAVWKPEAS